MKCPVCSAEIPSTAKFCGGCGATITSASPPRPAASPREPAAASVPPSNPVTPLRSPGHFGSSTPPVEGSIEH